MPTTGISLVRENTEQIRPPRALWVPFPLGQPFGAANDGAFQSAVLRKALALLGREAGPVILEDFPEDAPGQTVNPDTAMEGMVCPVRLRPPQGLDETEIVQQVRQEMAQLAPWRDAFLAANGRSIVGISGMALDEAVTFLGGLTETGGHDPDDDDQLGPRVRNATEDLRNWYIEAASARPGGPASALALANWFWGETAAGALTLALHPIAATSTNASLRAVGERALIPRTQQHRLAR